MSDTHQLSMHTQLAIESFRKVCLAERKKAREEANIGRYLMSAPEEDFEEYVRITEEIRNQYEEAT